MINNTFLIKNNSMGVSNTQVNYKSGLIINYISFI